MSLSTHVLDTALGRPAVGVRVQVERREADGWVAVADAVTDADGRIAALVTAAEWSPGVWRLVFDTASYTGAQAFFPSVTIEVQATGTGHLHVPLLLSPFGYSTYRGS